MSNISAKFTQELKDWLDDENRNYEDGALLLYRSRCNRIEYRKLLRNPDAFKEYIFKNIKKFYDFRVSKVSHEEVKTAYNKAIIIAATVENEATEKRTGKRADHDSLPVDIQNCYTQNTELMRQIADTHAKIRAIIQTNAACKDADLYPFAQHIIKLDKMRLANWKKYDTFNP